MKYSQFVLHENFINFPLYCMNQNKPIRSKLCSNEIKFTKDTRVKQYELKNLGSTKKKQLKQHQKSINKSDRLKLIQKTKNLFSDPNTQRYSEYTDRKRRSLSFRKKGHVFTSTGRYSVQDNQQTFKSVNIAQKERGKDFLRGAIYRTVIKIPEHLSKSRISPQQRALKSQEVRRRSELRNQGSKNIYKRPNTVQNNSKNKRASSEMLEPW